MSKEISKDSEFFFPLQKHLEELTERVSAYQTKMSELRIRCFRLLVGRVAR
jgi:hypothetical protein